MCAADKWASVAPSQGTAKGIETRQVGSKQVRQAKKSRAIVPHSCTRFSCRWALKPEPSAFAYIRHGRPGQTTACVRQGEQKLSTQKAAVSAPNSGEFAPTTPATGLPCLLCYASFVLVPRRPISSVGSLGRAGILYPPLTLWAKWAGDMEGGIGRDETRGLI